MRIIEGNHIKINRGNTLPLKLVIPISHTENYVFQVGDEIMFGIYGTKKMDEEALLLKKYTIEEETEEFEFTINAEEMKIGELINKPTDYWYEIELNGEQTILGYDDDGAKIITLYPEGSEIIGGE